MTAPKTKIYNVSTEMAVALMTSRPEPLGPYARLHRNGLDS